MFHFITRITRPLIFSLLLLIAILLSTTRVLFYSADLYKTTIQTQLSTMLDTPVTLGNISASMRGLHPQLVLSEIRLSSKTAPVLALQEIRIGLNLLDIWRKPQWQLATSVTLVGAKLTVLHKRDGSLVIKGLKSDASQPTWLLEGNYYELLQTDVRWQEEANPQKIEQFQGLDLLLKNDLAAGHHQLHVLSQTPNLYADSLRLSVDFTGNPFQADTLHADFYAQGKAIHLPAALQKSLPATWAVQTGQATFDVWGHWQHSALTQASGHVDGQHILVRRADRQTLLFKHLASDFSFENQQDKWTFALSDLHFALPHYSSPPTQILIGSPNKAAQHFSFIINVLDVGLAQNLATFFAKDLSGFKNLEGLNAKGQLRQAVMFADFAQQHYALRSEFRHLSLHNAQPALAIDNLSGSIFGTEQQGTLQLHSPSAIFTAQNLFRNPLKINLLSGNLHWQQSAENWQLSSADLQLHTPDARSGHKLAVVIPKNDQPTFIDLQTAFTLNDVRQAKRYFPTTIMTPGLVDYLDNAFLAGEAKNGRMLLYGHLRDFPFRRHEGVFQILFDARNVTMNYAPHWPLFKNLDAQVMFLDDSVEINVQHATSERARLQATKIRIPSFHDSDFLLAQGQVNATINDGLDFLRHTPLALPLPALSEQLTFAGNTQVDLDLQIALTDKVQSKVAGTAHLSDAQLSVRSIDLPITEVGGDLKFTESRFYSETLQGVAFGQPITAKINQTAAQTQIEVDGTVGLTELQKHFNVENQQVATGNSPYHLTLNLPFAEHKASQLQIESNLLGIHLALPDGLGKTATEKREFALTFDFDDSPFLPVRLHYAERLKAAVKLNKSDKKCVAGNVLLGKGELEPLARSGLQVKVTQASFSPLVWLGAWPQEAAGNDAAGILREFELHTQQLHWQEAQFGAVDLKVRHVGENWLGEMQSAALKGQVQILNNAASEPKWLIDLDYVDLSALASLKWPKQASAEGTEQKLPLLSVTSDKVMLNKVNLGKLELASQRVESGVKFSKIQLIGKEQKLLLTGDWQWEKGKPVTRINGQFTAEKFGDWLAKLELNSDFKETSADINLALQWQGAPYQFSLAGLNGGIEIGLNEGRILSIEPGFGRVLGVLAMAQWIKRLQLDFGDIYKEGLTFNKISGHFTLNNGKATSHDLIVDAVPAKINLIGEVNLAEKTLNQQITILPKSWDAVPIAGLIVGNITTAITQTLTGEYEEGYYLRSKYKVQGKWNNLSIIPLYEQDGLLQKIGRGLTDFSWINQPD